MAAATARQKSTSKPDQLFLSVCVGKPEQALTDAAVEDTPFLNRLHGAGYSGPLQEGAPATAVGI